MDKKNEPFEITEEMIKKAKTYISLADKIAFAKTIAEECIESVEMSVQKIQSDEVLALPQLYEENAMRKQLYLMQAFLRHYLGVEVPNEFGVADYDKYAKSHPMNQLKRFKSGNAEIKNKVFDLLADYKELKKLLEIEIYNAKFARNDTVERIFAGITVGSSPEFIQKAVEQLKATTEEFEQKKGELMKKTALNGKKKTEASNAQTKQFVEGKK